MSGQKKGVNRLNDKHSRERERERELNLILYTIKIALPG